jgi:hypothetical protein
VLSGLTIDSRAIAITAMKIPGNKSDRPAILDKWLILLVLLLLLTLGLFLLDYFPYPFGIVILSVVILARLASIYMMKKP